MVVIASLITASVGNKGPSESSPSIEPTSGRGQTLQHRLQTHRQVEIQLHILQLLEANHHRPCATPPFVKDIAPPVNANPILQLKVEEEVVAQPSVAAIPIFIVEPA